MLFSLPFRHLAPPSPPGGWMRWTYAPRRCERRRRPPCSLSNAWHGVLHGEGRQHPPFKV